MRDINTTIGTIKNCRMIVRNITGINEERGFRLFWQGKDESGEWSNYIMPALGYATSYPFKTEWAARAYALRNFGEKATRLS